jgi:hypothetical protein
VVEREATVRTFFSAVAARFAVALPRTGDVMLCEACVESVGAFEDIRGVFLSTNNFQQNRQINDLEVFRSRFSIATSEF